MPHSINQLTNLIYIVYRDIKMIHIKQHSVFIVPSL